MRGDSWWWGEVTAAVLTEEETAQEVEPDCKASGPTLRELLPLSGPHLLKVLQPSQIALPAQPGTKWEALACQGHFTFKPQ